MEGAASAAAGASMPIPAPAPAPAPSPQYTPPPTPAPMPSPMMAEGGDVGGGGSSSNKFKEFFSDINILDVAIAAFIVGGVLYAVNYYKFMIMMEKSGYSDLSTRVQRLESQLAAAKKTAEANAAGNGKMPMRNRRRALVTL